MNIKHSQTYSIRLNIETCGHITSPPQLPLIVLVSYNSWAAENWLNSKIIS